jgi:hypothetical protein
MPAYPALRTNNFFTIKIKHIPTAQEVSFEGWVTAFSDNYNSQWTATPTYGRMDSLATFQGTQRSIQLGFDVVNDDIQTAQINLKKIAQLMKFLYPVYEGGPRSQQNVLKAAPLLSIRWTNLIAAAGSVDANLVGYINGGIGYAPEMGEGGFMAPLMQGTVMPPVAAGGEGITETQASTAAGIANYIPKKVNLSFSFTVLHNHLVGWAPSDETKEEIHERSARLRGARAGLGISLAQMRSFTFGGNSDVDNDYPFCRVVYPEPGDTTQENLSMRERNEGREAAGITENSTEEEIRAADQEFIRSTNRDEQADRREMNNVAEGRGE